ncbi:MAG: PQQ-binding-like beta-propeller repeat protein, partial [Gammaproteobacteria bacterium]
MSNGKSSVPVAILTVMMTSGIGAQQPGLQDGEWPSYNRDLAGTRYSPLTQIDASNVADLEQVWTYALGRNQTTGELGGGSQFTPLVIDGVLYVAGADRLAALEPESGNELWRVMLGPAPPSRRGIGYWPGDDDDPARIYVTAGYSLIGIDPVTQEAIAQRLPVGYLGAPLVVGDKVFIGSNTPPGTISAYDAGTLAPLWVFRSTPRPGEIGHETWESDAWRDQPNLFHWAFSLTADEDRGLVYAAFESPGPNDYYGGDRPGDNLFGDSIVAVDIETGEYRWHYQTVHHDIWDFDIPAAPGLLDVEIDGEIVPLLALAGKTGYLYILNRETGEPVFGIEEVPVPVSTVADEAASPSQPIPARPPPLAKVSFSADDIVTAADTTAEHAAFCRDLVERSGGLLNAGPFTPYGYREPEARGASTIVFPGSIGGANWGGTAADPTLGYIFVNTMNEGSIGWIEEEPRNPGSYRRNSIFGS